MNILGIETSCDETAAAVVRAGVDVLGNTVASQVTLHADYGGVVPELAAREHVRAMQPVVDGALSAAGCELRMIDAVAVTSGPGLVPALLVGVSYAKGLAAALDCPFVGINHFNAHIYGAFFGRHEILSDRARFPLLALVVSGGHTALVLLQADGRTMIVGRTLDDAAGEAYDKAAKILDLGYPGGPVIDRLAGEGNPRAYVFPRGLTGGGGKPVRPENRFNFSFSGVKTALLYTVRDHPPDSSDLADLAASYQAAIVDVLVRKTRAAAREFGATTVCLCGGVACNRELRFRMASAMEEMGRELVLAEPRYCTDNAAMVAGLAYHCVRRGIRSGFDLNVSARLEDEFANAPFAPEYRDSCGDKEKTR